MTPERYCREICKGNFANRVALEKTLADYDAGLKAKELRKFAEWLAHNRKYNPMKEDIGFVWNDGIHFSTVDEILAEYEKENNDADGT